MTSVAVITTQQIGAFPQEAKKALGERSPSLDRTNAVEKMAQIEKVQEVPKITAPFASEFNFSYDRDMKQVITKVITDKEVVRQIPPEEVVQMYKTMSRLIKGSKSRLSLEG